jgi:site-specific DNA-methyltransferase (adenine-specific)
MSHPTSFHGGHALLFAGDCLSVLDALEPNSVDSVVTDPPYHLTSIVKRFGGAEAAPSQEGTDGLYARASRGFMGKQWDGGDIAFRSETWSKVFRVLKPGGHLVAFSAPKCSHRMVCAIEDAGFEIRDGLMWIFGSGFPKSHDVSKGIDRAAGGEREKIAIGAPVRRMIPGADQDSTGSWVKDNGREYQPGVEIPATDAAREWDGWGTALKPAYEPICLARKPLDGTVAANVLKHGVGAINIDACRVDGAGNKTFERASGDRSRENYRTGTTVGSAVKTNLGRWPANIVHDGSADVVEAFPAKAGGYDKRVGIAPGTRPGGFGNVGHHRGASVPNGALYGDSGSAARFFYSAKADAQDRLGSKHPTVKPVDLMQWLCRMVTPKGGLILDPFAGTGTTGEAALREGFRCILIEREEEYRADIARRMAHVFDGPDGRRYAIAKTKGARHDDLPLFGAAE